MVRRHLPFIALVGALLVSGDAWADKVSEAEDLFRRAKALQAQNKHAEACPMFEESQRLDPQMGTLLNVALCHEQLGKIASAWGEFRAVEQQARAAVPPREDRIKLAKEHADKLEPKISRLKIIVPPDARVRGLVVKIDGERKGEPVWSGAPVDPGTRVIEASAPGKKPATMRVRIDDEGTTSSVTIPKLEDAPVPSTPPTGGPTEEEMDANRSKKTTGFIIGGIGLATAAAGGVFGALAVVTDKAAADACPQPCIENSPAAANADQKTERALVFANIANIAVPLGLIGVGIGAFLVFTAGPTSKNNASASKIYFTASGIGGRF